jgi:hypothetical protein
MLFVVARRRTDGIFADIPRFADAVHGGNDRTHEVAEFFNGLLV